MGEFYEPHVSVRLIQAITKWKGKSIMKKIFLMLTALLIVISADSVGAQMGAGKSAEGAVQQTQGVTGAQSGKSSQMQGGRMMEPETMRDMSGMMQQMETMMQKMSGLMEPKGGMEHGKMMDMSKMLNDMSVTMKEMSGQMAAGAMDPAAMKTMQGRMKGMDQKMVNLEKKPAK